MDDEPHVVHIVRFKAENAGYQVSTANNGRRALELIHEQRPDLVVTDFQMPGGSGMELAKALYSDEATADILVIMVTARGHKIPPSELAQTNIRHLMPKPFSPRDLLARVRELLPLSGPDTESEAHAA